MQKGGFVRWCRMAPRYKIKLTKPERESLEALTHKGQSNAHKFVHARALLLCDVGTYYTPKHGSWLNIAEIELSVLQSQCLNRRIPNIDAMRRETSAWEADRNNRGNKTEWHFCTSDARIKLKHLYPTL